MSTDGVFMLKWTSRSSTVFALLLLLTAPAEAMMKFILLNGGDDRAYEGKLHELVRQ